MFANGMPITHEGKKTTTGHGCFHPTVLISGWSSKVFVNNQKVALKGKTKIQPHRCGKSVHDGVMISAAATVSFEE